MEEFFGVGGQAGGGVGWAVAGAGHSFFVDGDVEGLDRTEIRLNDVSHGHDVEEGGGGIAVGANPLKVERSESVGERRAGGEEHRALVFIQEKLGGVERHHENGHAAGEELLRGGDVAINVVFRLRAAVDAVTEIAVTAANGTSHQDNPIELAES